MTLEDFEREKTPVEESVGWAKIATINIGTGACLPMFVVASELAMSIGFIYSCLSALLASIFLSVIASFTGYTGAKSRVSSYMLVFNSFGKKYGKMLNILIALTYIGWLSISLAFFGEIMNVFMSKQFGINLPVSLWIMFGGLLTLSSSIFGFKGIDIFSMIFVPLLLILLYMMIMPALKINSFDIIMRTSGNGSISFGKAISLMIGSFIVGAASMPDITRYCRTGRDGAVGSILGFIGGQFVIALPCFIVALGYQNADFISVVIQHSTVVALFILLTAMWSNNDNNLYAIALSFATVFTNIKKVYLMKIVITALGILLACMEFVKLLIPFLSLLSIMIPSIAGLYVTDFFLNKIYGDRVSNTTNTVAILCWLIGSCTACLGYFDYITITTIPAVDGCVVSVLLYFMIDFLRKKLQFANN
ncbi:MAG: cytosine permease [Rickettsiales bacterium]|jgi:cytosine permease|nr:cytosine permease [Rickettsiales bacterium]